MNGPKGDHLQNCAFVRNVWLYASANPLISLSNPRLITGTTITVLHLTGDMNLVPVGNRKILFSENLVSHVVKKSRNKLVNQFVQSSRTLILHVRVMTPKLRNRFLIFVTYLQSAHKLSEDFITP